MGEQPKLLMPLRDGRSILWHSIQSVLVWEPNEVVVVVRPDLPQMTVKLTELGVRCVSNTRYEEGMATSLAAGIDALSPGTQAAIVTLGDQPYVSPRIIEELISAYLREGKPITIPVYGAQPGPPTLFARQVFPDLLKLQGDAGGRQIVADHPEMVYRVSFTEEDRPLDVDTPQDYQRLLRYP